MTDGGFYHKNNKDYYLKFSKRSCLAQNELLSSKIYDLAGIKTPNLFLINHGNNLLGLGSGIEKTFKPLNTFIQENKQNMVGLDKIPGIYEGIAIDALLANWDVVGTAFDDIGVYTNPTNANLEAFRMDVGGAGMYTGNGSHKGQYFKKEVVEWDLLRGKNGHYVYPISGAQHTNILSAQ